MYAFSSPQSEAKKKNFKRLRSFHRLCCFSFTCPEVQRQPLCAKRVFSQLCWRLTRVTKHCTEYQSLASTTQLFFFFSLSHKRDLWVKWWLWLLLLYATRHFSFVILSHESSSINIYSQRTLIYSVWWNVKKRGESLNNVIYSTFPHMPVYNAFTYFATWRYIV